MAAGNAFLQTLPTETFKHCSSRFSPQLLQSRAHFNFSRSPFCQGVLSTPEPETQSSYTVSPNPKMDSCIVRQLKFKNSWKFSEKKMTFYSYSGPQLIGNVEAHKEALIGGLNSIVGDYDRRICRKWDVGLFWLVGMNLTWLSCWF